MCLLALPGQANAQSRESLLVTADWLKQHLNDPALIVLHVGEKANYDAGHIAGARQITMQDLAATEPADHMSGEVLELPTPEAARARLESLGVSDGSHIVVYYDQGRVPPATRIVFTLDWLGLGERVSLLDGGLAAWKRAGGSVTKDIPVIKAGKLSARPIKPLTVTKEWVNENRGKPGIALIDARAAVFYDGTESGMSKRGHIPGAQNIPFTTVNDDAFLFKSGEQLKQLFSNAKVKPGDTVVAYCHIGMQGTAVLFAARTLGYKVMLYDGSFHDWEKHDLPVQTKPVGAAR
ncbi:MAG: sulfurtransferase [Longimicrobiales bacterium]